MRVAYFPNSCAQNSAPVIRAMLDSLRRAGHIVVENSMDCDAALIWSVLWSGRMAPNRAVYEHYRSHNRPVIIADVGTLRRDLTWKIAVNHITAMGYYGHKENLDWDRPRKLGVSIAINLTRNPAVLIAAQHRRSLQLAEQDQEKWIMEQIDLIKQVSDRPVVIRPHPRSAISISRLGPNIHIENPKKITGTYDSFDIHFDYHAVVNYSSGPGIQAAISGTRPLVSPHSLAFPVSVPIDDLDKPYRVDRDQWLIEICHTEYMLKEIEQGLWLQRLQPALI